MTIFKKSFIAGLTLVISAGGLYLGFSQYGGEHYAPRATKESKENSIQGAFEYMLSLKRNQVTGKVDLGDILAAREAILNQKLNKAGGLPLNWEATGPDNIGGRTRAILVDNRDNNVLYAGGVSGGLFKSTNKGASWTPVNDFQENPSVVSICQTADGTIYYGTGENGVNGLWQSDGEEYSSMVGEGIFKSTDGNTFTQLTTTKIFTSVNSLAVNPIDNTIYAGTDRGLYYSDDQGATWKSLKTGNCREVKISSNGTVLAYVASILWYTTNGKDANSYVRSNNIPANARVAMAFSPEDPNYAYAFVAGSVSISTTGGTINVSSGMVGLYQSKDGGANFTQVIGKESQYFAPLTHIQLGSSQGTYDLVVAVHPKNKERVFMGGISWAEWTPASGPSIVGNNFDAPTNPFGIHSDKHYITFDTKSNPIIMYIGSDGGVSKTTNAEMTNYASINNGYVTTQFYGMAAGTNGVVIGGCQDNNTIMMDRKGSTRQRGTAILGGDGFRCEISKINPSIFFIESQYGGLYRTLNGGGGAAEIWDNRITASHVSKNFANGIFNTPIRLWENEANGTGRLYYGMNSSVWMAKGVIESGAEIRWFKIANLPADPHIIEPTNDGKSLYIGTRSGLLYRVNGLDIANFDTTEIVAYDGISDSLSMSNVRGNLPSGRAITDVALDKNNPNRVIVTMGNYGNTSFIYVTENAMDPVPTWRSLQGNLPKFPVYDVEIYEKDPNTLVVGTEFGVWACTNGQATTPTWSDQSNGKFPRVPVYEMRQVSEKAWTGPIFYASTHGRGIFESRNLLTSVNNGKAIASVCKLYPNPANESTSLQFSAPNPGNVTAKIYDLKGNLIESKTIRCTQGMNNISFETSKYANGMYIASIEGAVSARNKFMVAH